MSKPAGFDWSAETMAALRHLWNDARDEHGQKIAAPEIARRLVERFGGVLTSSAVIGKARRMALDPRPSPLLPLHLRRAVPRPVPTTGPKGNPKVGPNGGAGAVAKARALSQRNPHRGAGCHSSGPSVRPAAGPAEETPRDGGPREAAGVEQPIGVDAAPVAPRVPVLGREPDPGCRWPMEQDPVSRLWRYCGDPRDDSRPNGRPCPYCLHHRSIAFVSRPAVYVSEEVA